MNPRKVRLTCDIIDPACGDHPALLIASKGEVCEVLERDGVWSCYVRTTDGREIGLKFGEYKEESR